MKYSLQLLILLFIPFWPFSQVERINRKQFFEGDSPLVVMHLSAYFQNISSAKNKSIPRPAHVKLQIGDGIERVGNIDLRARGDFRFENCFTPPVMLYFNTPGASTVGGLGKLKMVWGCEDAPFYDQLVLREYIAYKIYNELTPLSFRVRRMVVHFSDSAKPAKLINKQAFFIEDIDEVAKRAKYREWESEKAFPTEVERSQYILLTLFQYLIGNTDWGLTSGHNIKFIVPKESVSGVPIAIPFDFDFSGLVDAPYALAPEDFPISSVRERFYMCTIPDTLLIEKWLDYFLIQKSNIFAIINNCQGLSDVSKKEMTGYVSDFYTLIENRDNALKVFLNPLGVKQKK